MRPAIAVVLIFSLISSLHTSAQSTHSDNGDGTYTNPFIPADFPDPDVIRVDTTYYMVTTTMFVFPGVTILKSHDLINWEYCSNAVAALISAIVMILIPAIVMATVSGQRV